MGVCILSLKNFTQQVPERNDLYPASVNGAESFS